MFIELTIAKEVWHKKMLTITKGTIIHLNPDEIEFLYVDLDKMPLTTTIIFRSGSFIEVTDSRTNVLEKINSLSEVISTIEKEKEIVSSGEKVRSEAIDGSSWKEGIR